jgi:hypothetical protein
MADIKVIKNFISDDDSNFIISYIDNNCEDVNVFRSQQGVAWKEGTAYRSIFPLEKPYEVHSEEIIEGLIGIANKIINIAKDHYKYENELYIEGFSLTKLTPGIQLRIHKDDHHHDFVTSKVKKVHGEDATWETLFSAMVYLNDDYSDGEIIFLNDWEEKSNFDIYEDEMNGTVYKPSKNDLVLFESKTWHGSRKVNGDLPRYAVAFWFSDKNYWPYTPSLNS